MSAPADLRSAVNRAAVPLGVALLLILAIVVGWTGFIASDDALYFVGAEHWLVAPPFAGDTHWATRFPLIWSFDAMLLLLGRNFAAFAATALLWYALLVLIVAALVRRLEGMRAAYVAALLVGTMPVVIANATTVSVDLLEAFMLVAGAWLIADAGAGRNGYPRAVLAGICFGTAVLCRETSLLSLSIFAPLFLIGRPVRRDTLVAAGIGIALVLGSEALFQYAMTGQPLHRYDLAFHHDSHIDRAANMEGNFLLHPAIDPLLVLLINDDFGLLFWVAGAVIALALRTGAWRAQPRPLQVMGLMAAANFLLVAVLVHKLVLNPRYFMLPALWAAVVVAIGMARASVRWRWGVVAGLVAINLAFLSVGNRHPRWEMEAMLDAARRHPGEIVYGDAAMARRARLPMRFEGLSNVQQGPAPAGSLEIVPADQAPDAPVLTDYRSPPTLAGAVLQHLGLASLVPGALRPRLFEPSPRYRLVRTPAS